MRVGRAGNDSEVGIPQCALGSAKYDRITDVKEIATELKVRALFYREHARLRHVLIMPVRGSQAIAPQVSIGSYLRGGC